MKARYFAITDIWQFPQSAVPSVLSEMAIDGSKGNEGITLFLGVDAGTTTEITHLVRLRGNGITKHPDQITISPALFNEVTDIAIKEKVRLIGQVHSHGPGYCLDLSPTDRRYGIRTPDYLSLVAPNYAMTDTPIHEWGIHVFVENQGYVRLPDQEVKRRIELSSGPPLPFLTVGEDNGL
jgi:hypothetical protein